MDSQDLPPTSLFRLPREVRDVIYTHALTAPASLITWPIRHQTLGLNAALLRASRAVHAEAAPILYVSNRFNFTHPSDANMFVKIMDPAHAPSVTSLTFRVRDRDVRLWTAYLSSSSPIRSLQCDFPRLRSLTVVLRSAAFWHALDGGGGAGAGVAGGGGDVFANLPRWVSDPKLRELCLSLQDRTPAEIRIVCVYRVPRADLQLLLQAHPHTLSMNAAGEVRSAFTRAYEFDVALELSPIDPPAV